MSEEKIVRFLRKIVSYSGAATSRECGLASREEDRSRQKARRFGLARFKDGYWRITDEGRIWLSRKDTKDPAPPPINKGE